MPAPDPKATSTQEDENRFRDFLYVRVSEIGTIMLVERRTPQLAHKKITITVEYPKYAKELEIKKEATRWDQQHNAHYVDYDLITEQRVRHCLVSWDLHEQFPGMTQKLHRRQGMLEDESLEHWKKLPPVLRKSIGNMINEHIGPA